MNVLLLPDFPSLAGIPRDADASELLPPPDRSSAPPEDALPALRLCFGEFSNNAASKPNIRTSSALVLSMASGHSDYASFEAAMKRYSDSLGKLGFQHIAFSAAHSGGRYRAALGDGASRTFGMFAQVDVVLPLAEPVLFSGVTLVEYLRTAVDVAKSLGLPDVQLFTPDRGIRPPCGSVFGAHYSSKLKGPRLDLAAEIRRRQVEAHVAQLKSKLATLEEGASALQAQIEGVRGQIQNPVLPANHLRKAF